MKRITAWIGGMAGAAAGYRWLRRQREEAPEPVPTPDERAEELRAKLAEGRAAEPAVEEPAVEEPAAEEADPEPEPEAAAEESPAPEPETPDERRQRVHEEGRAALGEMKPE